MPTGAGASEGDTGSDAWHSSAFDINEGRAV